MCVFIYYYNLLGISNQEASRFPPINPHIDWVIVVEKKINQIGDMALALAVYHSHVEGIVLEEGLKTYYSGHPGCMLRSGIDFEGSPNSLVVFCMVFHIQIFTRPKGHPNGFLGGRHTIFCLFLWGSTLKSMLDPSQ